MHKLMVQAALDMKCNLDKQVNEWAVAVFNKHFPGVTFEDAAKNFTLNVYPHSKYEIVLAGEVVAEFEVTTSAQDHMHKVSFGMVTRGSL